MDPLFMLEAKGFRATSGNQVVRVIELGEDGMIPCWSHEPSLDDTNELVAWARTKLPAGAEITNDMGRTLQKAREHYVVWKKKGFRE